LQLGGQELRLRKQAFRRIVAAIVLSTIPMLSISLIEEG